MPAIPWTEFVDLNGRWFQPYRSAVLPPIRPLSERPKKGTYVIVFKAEMRYQYEEPAVPPDTEGQVMETGFEAWTEKRQQAKDAIETQSKDVSGQHKGKVISARIYRVDVKVTPMRSVILSILNKQGVEGDAKLIWELNGGQNVKILLGGA